MDTADGEVARREAVAALDAIKEASGQALAELRSALGTLREDDAAPRHPVPDLGDLPRLARQWREAGLAVTVEGDPGTCPPAVSQVAYRVIEEGLTNVTRHSRAATAAVGLAREGRDLVVTVVDPGPGRADRSSGDASRDPRSRHGLDGMRERVRALGGSVAAGPDGSGWAVRALLPSPDGGAA
jgi:signal transduction histidine kinase